MESFNVNQQLAHALRAVVTGSGGEADASLRAAALERAAGGSPIAQPYDDLARQIGEAAYRVTDAHVVAVRDATGSDKGAFEIIMSACIGAGLSRWDAAVRAIEGAGDAAS
ncbi:hypothetical protein ELQ90_16290 [Labedella phragmitis]|uniref:Carboxymuconolactone decarboxylase family protein n=1 Tax=Labedella phragmitis TaxID=2498849 RepID=A0A444PP57_9MICO|nr:hypothetical protein [Labedella phragmitis]RWZ46045.1 hypothetical protein ELQ90_16290 [Labedella phragmitis]